MEEFSETAAEQLQNRVDELLQLFNGLVVRVGRDSE